jgi:hypothetical protein
VAVIYNAKGTSVSSFSIGKGGPSITANAAGILEVADGAATQQPIGYNTIPIYEIDAADIFDLAHAGMMWHKDSGGAVTFTADEVAAIPQGSSWIVHNDDTEDLTIAEGVGVTIQLLSAGAPVTSGDVTVEQGGIVTVYKYTDAIFWVWGSKSADSAALITVADESADTTCFPLFVTAATGDLGAKTGTNLAFNSSTGLLTTTAVTTTGDMTADNFEATGLGPLQHLAPTIYMLVAMVLWEVGQRLFMSVMLLALLY